MFSFLSEFTRDPNSTYTVLVMDEEGMEQPRPYRVRPKRLLMWWTGTALALALALLALVIFTPLREWIPGYGTAEIQRSARLNALRLAAMQDSLAMQQQYMTQLRKLVLGQIDSSLVGGERPPEPALAVSGELAEVTADPLSKDWTDHEQPALSLERLPADEPPPVTPVSTAGERYLARLRFPVLPPVNGFLTRGFDARTGHYAIDLAVEEGSVVRAVETLPSMRAEPFRSRRSFTWISPSMRPATSALVAASSPSMAPSCARIALPSTMSLPMIRPLTRTSLFARSVPSNTAPSPIMLICAGLGTFACRAMDCFCRLVGLRKRAIGFGGCEPSGAAQSPRK